MNIRREVLSLYAEIMRTSKSFKNLTHPTHGNMYGKFSSAFLAFHINLTHLFFWRTKIFYSGKRLSAWALGTSLKFIEMKPIPLKFSNSSTMDVLRWMKYEQGYDCKMWQLFNTYLYFLKMNPKNVTFVEKNSTNHTEETWKYSCKKMKKYLN